MTQDKMNDSVVRSVLIKKGLLGACPEREHTGKTAKKREKERNARATAKADAEYRAQLIGGKNG